MLWTDRMWQKLLAWVEDEQWLRRALVLRRAARPNLLALLAPDALGRLTRDALSRTLCSGGAVTLPDGSPLSHEDLETMPPDELTGAIEAGGLLVSGNQSLDVSSGARDAPLPGMHDPELEALRVRLTELLYGSGDPAAAIERLTADNLPPRPACASLMLCMLWPQRFGIWHPMRVAGARRLAWLLGTEAAWAGCYRSYRAFNGLLAEIRDNSRGVLEDLLAVDAFLAHLGSMREPRCWKVAIALSEPAAQADAITARCLRRGFAAVKAPPGERSTAVAHMREMLPGDCVAMHLRGRIGAVGRVLRPHYELDPSAAGVLDRGWRHRIDVEWLAGDRDYGSLLGGARQRNTVVELDEPLFWRIAEMYEDDPNYGNVLRPRRGAWVVRCEPDHWERLYGVERPLPLRAPWRLRAADDSMRVGDTAFIHRRGDAPGICGLAKVVGEPVRDGSGVRVDLLHERWFDPSLSPSKLAADERTGDCALIMRPDGELNRLTGGETVAVEEMLELTDESYFVLMIERASRQPLRSRMVCRYSHRAGGRPDELTQAAELSRANCLIYHGAPDYAFVGFGPIEAVRREAGAPEAERFIAITIALTRFTADSHIRSLPPAVWRQRVGDREARSPLLETQAVLPICPRDYYRVVAGGLGVGPPVQARRDIEWMAEQCCMPLEAAREMERLLRERGQMIFYGPPGTGKTWCALQLADYLVDGDPQRRQLVQFHPAYSYEDFIEGIRPQTIECADGRSEINYPVVPGAFTSFCERARLDPDRTYVFVIDEINRAHIARVFGELMLLLEYRGREMQLALSGGESRAGEPWRADVSAGFSVPDNVLVLGTMNTADRSLALVDHALRRRFVFYPFYPDDDRLVRPMFTTWLAHDCPDMLWVADLLDLVNERLATDVGRHLLIGHSYFMRPGLDDIRLREIWRFQIQPLLEEYFAGVPERLAEYDLDELIAQVRPDFLPVPERKTDAIRPRAPADRLLLNDDHAS